MYIYCIYVFWQKPFHRQAGLLASGVPLVGMPFSFYHPCSHHLTIYPGVVGQKNVLGLLNNFGYFLYSTYAIIMLVVEVACNV